MTFGEATNSPGKAWWPDSTGMCETCGNAWARAPQVSVTHLEDFYFFMDCTGHEIIISSALHPTPHQLESAFCCKQIRCWAVSFVQGHGPVLCHDLEKATNSVGKACWPESAGMCETWQARVCPNWLCDFGTYFQARMRVFVFATHSSLKHVNPSRQLAHKDTKACDIATRHTARPYGLHMLSVLPSNGNMALEIILLLAVPAMG